MDAVAFACLGDTSKDLPLPALKPGSQSLMNLIIRRSHLNVSRSWNRRLRACSVITPWAWLHPGIIFSSIGSDAVSREQRLGGAGSVIVRIYPRCSACSIGACLRPHACWRLPQTRAIQGDRPLPEYRRALDMLRDIAPHLDKTKDLLGRCHRPQLWYLHRLSIPSLSRKSKIDWKLNG